MTLQKDKQRQIWRMTYRTNGRLVRESSGTDNRQTALKRVRAREGSR